MKTPNWKTVVGGLLNAAGLSLQAMDNVPNASLIGIVIVAFGTAIMGWGGVTQ